jgi:SAM-dependent methyltransferase
MTAPVPSPRDFAVGFSPEREAELVLWQIDERPPSRLSPRGVVRALRGLAQRRGADKRHANDAAAEQAWAELGSGPGRVPVEAFADHLTRAFAADYLRTFEYAFLARCLGRPDVRTDVVVDMGGGNSYSTVVPLVLCPQTTRILSVDVVNHPAKSRYNVEYVRGDCIHTSLRAESADVVAIISTLEHVGLGRWGDPLDPQGDVKAMREAWRVLRPGGHVVLTIPYGHPAVVFNLHRVYDRGRVGLLTEGFDVVQAEYSKLGRSVGREEIEGAPLVPPAPGANPRDPYAGAPQLAGGGMFLLRKGHA